MSSRHIDELIGFYVAVGQVNLCSPDHVALLVHRTFNVSIPRHHLPTNHWEFQYGAAENDPEFGPDAAANKDGNREEDAQEGEEGGKWIHSITGAKLGGSDGFLEFTVIGYDTPSHSEEPMSLIVLIGLLLRMKCFPYRAHYSPIHSLPHMSLEQQ